MTWSVDWSLDWGLEPRRDQRDAHRVIRQRSVDGGAEHDRRFGRRARCEDVDDTLDVEHAQIASAFDEREQGARMTQAIVGSTCVPRGLRRRIGRRARTDGHAMTDEDAFTTAAERRAHVGEVVADDADATEARDDGADRHRRARVVRAVLGDREREMRVDLGDERSARSLGAK